MKCLQEVSLDPMNRQAPGSSHLHLRGGGCATAGSSTGHTPKSHAHLAKLPLGGGVLLGSPATLQLQWVVLTSESFSFPWTTPSP